MRSNPITLLTLALALALLGACAGRSPVRTVVQDPRVPQPLTLGDQTAFELAGRLELPQVAPGEYPGLHNVFRLSNSILCGAEPADDAALAQLGEWGVRTVISVDGKAPEVEAAAALGLRYVHVPIQYTGISEDQVDRLAKTFRELEGPFYVHCYHGKHRGPAAAALGRVVLDGLERDQAIAEMRQWCSTSEKYEGLYQAVATGELPTTKASAAYEYDFAPVHRIEGVRAVMVAMTRHWDRVKDVRRNGWQVDPQHPDVDPLREAQQVREHYESFEAESKGEDRPEDYWQFLRVGRAASEELVDALGAGKLEEVEEAFDALKANCLECHAGYRDQ